MPAPVVDSVLDLVGETPVVKLRRLSPEGGATIWGKCEHLNPGGSVKDRICLAMIEVAEADGRLKPGDTIVEPTSGNTGIGLALVCARKGYKLVLTMPASMSLERRALLEAYGVEIVLTEPDRVMEGAMEAARRIESPGVPLRFVAFTLEEAPAFFTKHQGSRIYVERAAARGERVLGAIVLEMVGYTCPEQNYPLVLQWAGYPKEGNFIGVVGDWRSRRLNRAVRRGFKRTRFIDVLKPRQRPTAPKRRAPG